jgi:hypothetical protein
MHDNPDKIEYPPIILDPSDPASLHQMVPPWLSQFIQNIPMDYFEMPEEQFKATFKPGYTFEMLRTSFWLEYLYCLYAGSKKITLARVYSFVCDERMFMKACRNPITLAWILKPPKHMMTSLRTTLNRTTQRLFEIAEVPLFDERGKPKYTAMKIVMSLHKDLDQRFHGAPVQRQITAHVNLNKEEDLDKVEARMNDQLKAVMEQKRKLLETGVIDGEIISGTASPAPENSGDGAQDGSGGGGT